MTVPAHYQQKTLVNTYPNEIAVALSGPLSTALAVSGVVIDLCVSSGDRTTLIIQNSGCTNSAVLSQAAASLFIGQTGTAASLQTLGIIVVPSGMVSISASSGVRYYGVSHGNGAILNVRVIEMN
ncbi:MAG: hypothetical protein MN733_13485 [Nitrososphaera sp.]|nr:hypothetical protein [Nitrososphaera sp.]